MTDNQKKLGSRWQAVRLNRCRVLAAAAAAAASAIGLLTVPSPAQADDCPMYEFNGRFDLKQGSYTVSFPAHGFSVEGGRASVWREGERGNNPGEVNARIQGRNVDFAIAWYGGARGRYTGVVDGNGFVQGQTHDETVPGSTATWKSTIPLMCVRPAAPPPPPPAPPLPTKSIGKAPPATPLATATGDVDVYAQPNVQGNLTPIGILRTGKTVELVGNCVTDDWCQVTGADVPGGQGWVWGHLRF